VTGPARAAAQRAYYSATLTEFCTANLDVIFGRLARQNDFELIATQRDAWLEQATILQTAVSGHAGAIYLEFTIPRMGRRVDAIIIIGAVIFVLEFKVGERHFTAHDVDQVTDYALDLQNFHEGSHDRYIAPVLVCTHADDHQEMLPEVKPSDRLFSVARTNAKGLPAAIGRILNLAVGPPVDIDEWECSRYKPTPTIIEATLALYRGHSVADISRSDAGARNLSVTGEALAEIIEDTKVRQEKAICFITGVPGAGKTLVGLDAATRHINREDELYSVFLSGNGPLVAILQEALARDKVRQSRLRGGKIRKGAALSEVRAFIQNVHHFRDDCLVDADRPPIEHVAIFDEAQRAWNTEQTAYFMRRKKARRDFAVSEPEFLISCLNRHQDWAVVICLVGGGQEINTGEAGIAEWFDALDRSFRDWRIYVSDRLVDSEYSVSDRVNSLHTGGRAECKSELHLATSIRSFRSENVSMFVKELLDLNVEAVRETLQDLQTRYPIVLTRDVGTARTWLRGQARGSERYGIVVSSQAERLKPHAVDVRTPIDPVHWFLDSKDDVRSSYYLEDVATEFHVQGLELDWVCVVWDADFRFSTTGWEHWSFRGNRWQRIQSMQRRRYLKNAYRVLLTRARQGMVLVVPHGDDHDATRHKNYYDPTFQYLRDSGISVI
jgi:hypothetical protein